MCAGVDVAVHTPTFSHSYSTSARRHVALDRPSCDTSLSSLQLLRCGAARGDGSRTLEDGSSSLYSSGGRSSVCMPRTHKGMLVANA